MADPVPRVTVTCRGQITLPIEVCRVMGIRRGDQLEISVEDGEIHLRTAPRFSPLTGESSLFKLLGAYQGPGGSGARDDDRLLASKQRQPNV